MTQCLIMILIVCFESAIIYGSAVLGKKDPKIITGFKWGKTPQEIEKDKLWIALFYRAFSIAAIITLLGGAITAIIGETITYCIALCAPAIIAVIYCAAKQPKKSE